ncbi:MAG: DUF3301 domain-containing protein [Pseudomonadota bacterium]
MEMLLVIVIVGSATWLWLDTARARDLARQLARRLCDESKVQLLDQTVALRRTWPVRVGGRLMLERGFSFEFSEDGAHRLHGQLTMVGVRLRHAVLDGERIGRVIVQPQ